MAAISTAGSGNWSSTTPNAPWPGGTLPTSADDVTIANTHTVTVDVTTAVANTVTVAGGGTLQPSTGANSKLTTQLGVTTNNTASPVSNLLYDMSAAPNYTTEIRLSGAGAASGAGNTLNIQGNFVLKGAAKTPYAYTKASLTANSSTSVEIDDVTGWKVGDKLVFATTQAYNATPRTDLVSIASITPTSGAAATVAWTDGAGTGGAVLYDHANVCLVGNFTRNVIFGPATAYHVAAVNLVTSSRATDGRIDHVMFDRVKVTNSYPQGILRGSGASVLTSISSNAFFDYVGQTNPSCGYLFTNSLSSAPARSNNLFYADTATPTAALSFSGQSYPVGDENSPVVFRSFQGAYVNWPGGRIVDPKISGVVDTNHGGVLLLSNDSLGTVSGGGIWACRNGNIAGQGGNAAPPLLDGVRFGTGPSASAVYDAANLYDQRADANYGSIYRGCPEHSSGFTFTGSPPTTTEFYFLNRNGNTAVQEVYAAQSFTIAAKARDATTTTRSTSAMRMEWVGTANGIREHTFQVLAKSGVPIRILCYVRKNASYGSATLPKVTVSGLGITPVVATMSAGTAADAWELLTLDATQSSGSDGLLTVALTGQSAVNGAKCWFAGVPLAPFVTRCRHYGYLFDETLPTRTTDALSAVNEATAAAYTGMSVSWGASQSNVTVSDNNTFQKLYDYHQSQAVLNVGSALALTGSGSAGSPSLFAAGNVTVSTTKVLNGSGAVSMGSKTLTAELNTGGAYTYTGGTYSRLTTLDSFSGGTLNIGASGTYVFGLTSAILSMTPTTPSTYAMGGATFSGTVDLRNAAAHAITVELPSGTSYTTANNTGGVITVSTPALYQSVTISGAAAGSRIQVYDTTSSTELYNGTPAFPYTWTDSVAAAANRAIRLRVSKVSGATAKEFIEANIDACGQTSGTAAVSYLVSQADDAVYNTNGIDGSTVTGITITPSPARVKINIAGGAVTWKSVYAYQVYWLGTATGIADEAAFIEAPDTANYLFTGFDLRNDSTTPLTITGGFGRDAVTGSVADLIDVAGSAGNIYPTPDHVVPFSTGSGLTAGEQAQLASAASSSANAAAYALLARELLSNKHVLDPASGLETVHGDDGSVLYTRQVYSDAAGTIPYNGTTAPHRVEKYA